MDEALGIIFYPNAFIHSYRRPLLLSVTEGEGFFFFQNKEFLKHIFLFLVCVFFFFPRIKERCGNKNTCFLIDTRKNIFKKLLLLLAVLLSTGVNFFLL